MPVPRLLTFKVTTRDDLRPCNTVTICVYFSPISLFPVYPFEAFYKRHRNSLCQRSIKISSTYRSVCKQSALCSRVGNRRPIYRRVSWNDRFPRGSRTISRWNDCDTAVSRVEFQPRRRFGILRNQAHPW